MEITDQNFEEELKKAGKPVIVDFYADWCGPCRALGPILEKVANDYKDKVVLFKANVNESPNMAEKYQADRIPMVVLFKNGEPADGFVGFSPEENIREWLDNALGKEGKDTGKNDEDQIVETMAWSAKYANDTGIKLNPDEKAVERVAKGLLANEKKYGEKYCPCRRVKGDKEEDKKIICPCIYHKDEIEKDGKCFCGLFVK